MMIDTTDLTKSIAERRTKRDATDMKKINQQQWAFADVKRQTTRPKKSQERGWYRVEGILGHRIVRVKNKDQIELKVKWEDYSEPTWEGFSGFVKDTAPMVERYLLKKSLMKPLQAFKELKKQKSLDLKSSDPTNAVSIRNNLAIIENILVSHGCLPGTSKGLTGTATNEASQAISMTPSASFQMKSEHGETDASFCPGMKRAKRDEKAPSHLAASSAAMGDAGWKNDALALQGMHSN